MLVPDANHPSSRLTFNPTAALVRDILAHPFRRDDWTLQGFGMLRTYLTPELRLHVWDSRYSNGASPVHDHPWDFVSYVVAGAVVNCRFAESIGNEVLDDKQLSVWRRTIRPGEGLQVIGTDVPVTLKVLSVDRVGARQWYFQDAAEIHESKPIDGTVTLVNRKRPVQMPDIARSYYAKGTSWVSGEPRKATPEEVESICAYSLARWFS